MTLQLSIIIPAYNEADRLAEGMRRFEAAAASGAVDLERTELLLVDDGSTDHTAIEAEKLLAALPHHRIVRVNRNQGKGAAIRTGVARARAPLLAYMDADMAIDPHAISQLLDGLTDNELAIGSRALPESMVETTYALRSLMGRLFNTLVTTGTGLGLLDTQCGFKAFRTPAARLLFHLVRIDRFAFDVEVLYRAHGLGLRITEVPVLWRHVPGSSIHPLHDSVAMLADVYGSRLGLRAAPPVTALTVRGNDRGSMTELASRVADVLGRTLDGVPLPLLAKGVSITALMALVEPSDVAQAFAALRAEFEPLEVGRRTLTLDALRSLGPLAGRLDGLHTEGPS
jgi:glycosyltransferase involved in cell wall biosynthesis